MIPAATAMSNEEGFAVDAADDDLSSTLSITK